MNPRLWRRCLTELIGTFLLVLFGCGSMMVNADTGLLTHPGVAAAWGGIVAVLIYAIGDISGAHLNPAVSIAFAAVGRFSWKDAAAYVPTQCLAAILAAACLAAAVPDGGAHLGSTDVNPAISLGTGWAIELLLTAVLMFVIMGVSTGAKEKSITAGLAVGAIIGLEALIFGPLTKASMNPARSLGPALVDAGIYPDGPAMSQLWIYLTATVVGALAGGFVYQFLLVEAAQDQT